MHIRFKNNVTYIAILHGILHMKKNYLLVMLIAMCFTADVWAEGGWKLLYESEGVTVSSREVPV